MFIGANSSRKSSKMSVLAFGLLTTMRASFPPMASASFCHLACVSMSFLLGLTFGFVLGRSAGVILDPPPPPTSLASCCAVSMKFVAVMEEYCPDIGVTAVAAVAVW
jgi:hypothetical protein